MLEPLAVEDAASRPVLREGSSGEAVVRAQILLDRVNYSPGEIDGRYGGNLRRAVRAFQEEHGLAADGVVGTQTWRALEDSIPTLTRYALRQQDVGGPFAEIPEDMMEKAKLPALSYETALEGIAEAFHASPALLRKLNPEAAFQRAGEEILVPNVVTAVPEKAASVVVDESELSVTVLDPSGRVLARYPASVGSKHDPLPVGRWEILRVQRNPRFHYKPDLFWDADPSHAKATLAPGPNSPVGVVWIDLSKEHYGIHGTAEPGQIGNTQSHGCIRLTNWDALELAELVGPGTPALLQE